MEIRQIHVSEAREVAMLASKDRHLYVTFSEMYVVVLLASCNLHFVESAR